MTYQILPDQKFFDEVNPVVDRALADAQKILEAEQDFRVALSFDENDFVRDNMNGSSGVTGTGDLMFVSVDQRAPQWKKDVYGSVVHEYNHVVWNQEHGSTYRKETLKGLIAMEGVAQCFEEELCGEIPPYARAIDRERAKELWKKLQPYLNKPAHKWKIVWFGDGEEFPVWSGYTLAYILVKERIDELQPPVARAFAKARGRAYWNAI